MVHVGGCGGSQVCSLKGCRFRAQFDAPMPAQDGDVIVVQACQNAACAETKLTLSSGCAACVPACDLQASGASCVVDKQGEAGAWRLVLIWSGTDGPGAADGDRYLARVTRDTDGEVLLEAEERVTYATEYPNGPDCQESPCRFVDQGAFSSP